MSIPKLGIVNGRQDFNGEFQLHPFCIVNKNDENNLIFGLDESNSIIDLEIKELITKNKIQLITEIICSSTFLYQKIENFNTIKIEKDKLGSRILINSFAISTENFKLNKTLLSSFWFNDDVFFKKNQKISQEFSLIVKQYDNYIKGDELDFVSIEETKNPDQHFEIDLLGDQITIYLHENYYNHFRQRMNDKKSNSLLSDVITSQAIIMAIVELMNDGNTIHSDRKWYVDLTDHLKDRNIDLNQEMISDNKYFEATKIYNKYFDTGNIKNRSLDDLMRLMEIEI